MRRTFLCSFLFLHGEKKGKEEDYTHSNILLCFQCHFFCLPHKRNDERKSHPSMNSGQAASFILSEQSESKDARLRPYFVCCFVSMAFCPAIIWISRFFEYPLRYAHAMFYPRRRIRHTALAFDGKTRQAAFAVGGKAAHYAPCGKAAACHARDGQYECRLCKRL